CDDGNVCTTDSCEFLAGCVYTNNSSPCDDNDACTKNESCENGICSGGQHIDCDDGNSCTDDTCVRDQGCQHIPNHSCDNALDCNNAFPTVSVLWPPNHKMVPVNVSGIVNQSGYGVSITITGVMQDEDIGSGGRASCPDAEGLGTDTARLRAER